jgi:predicted DCC family thiol-disulfide oxidoreductase YuxK
MAFQLPILIYDGHCNLCIRLVKFLEPMNREQHGYRMTFLPFQNADELIKDYKLNPDALRRALHFIDANGDVFAAGTAIEKLADVFPLLKVGSGIFATAFGDAIYTTIAANRYRVFGCSDDCYVSESGKPIEKIKETTL